MGYVCGSTPDLSAIRSSRAISLDEIARTTNIRAFYLRAIESGELDKLPPGVYLRAYIRQYARAIDYNEELLLEQFHLAGGAAPETQPEPERLSWLARLLRMIVPASDAGTPGSERTG